VVAPDDSWRTERGLDRAAPAGEWPEAFVGAGAAVASANAGVSLDGLATDDAKRVIGVWLAREGLGAPTVTYKLRDWLFSRQRYWGEPFPIVYDDDGLPVALPAAMLPVELPELHDFAPRVLDQDDHSTDPEPPLARVADWVEVELDLGDGPRRYRRETNTMPQWAGSCWYYLRYLDPGNTGRIFSEQSYDDWMPVDLYVGGSEHAVLHLLYARFWHKVLFDVGVVKHPEPFTKLVHQGMMLGQSYRWYAVLGGDGEVLRALDGDDARVRTDRESGKQTLEGTGETVEARWLGPADIRQDEGVARHPEHGVRLFPIAEKMSKSRGNVVNPDSVVEEFGADALRVYEMFMGPLEQVKPWQASGIQGVRRFLDRVHTVVTRPLADQADEETARLLHRTVKKVTEDVEALRYNTAVSAMMIFANHLAGLERTPREAAEKLVLCLSPYAPHLAEELWEHLGHPGGLASAEWPSWDEALCVDAVIEMPVQVNGKVRGRVVIPRDATEAVAREAALRDENVQKFVAGGTVRKVVFVPGRILNVIVG
ncbi:MAG: class I tRNA ligase family protein, partial [Deltaproteobacteria bacterium]|nr:class I tRNA ligase family protein [Deltaproteobacteria bacterium]